eukprot:TRINITY_DN236_c0_g1_i3.p1 TRINITY_DN236_c0_g1~~TRINITY_DN236_c0_g1_i3.p1  ORF type:complete len:527 (+),score=152.20 TRINITY_DN236_c0_g1_i3:64-1581(+)
MSAARDMNSFAQKLNKGARPPASSVVYDGAFNEHSIQASSTTQLIEPFGHCGIDRFGKLFVGVEIVSCFDGKPRNKDIPLDAVFVIDISGSMASQIGSSQNRINKLDAVKLFSEELTQKFEPGDTVSVVIFDDKAETLLHPTKVSEGGLEKVRSSLKNVRTRGGTVISSGLGEGIKVAREAKKMRNTSGPQETRLVLLTDMGDGEVRSAEKVIQEMTVKAALEDNIHCSYIGIGEDFQQELTEKITVAEGSNYFCIMNQKDFTKRVASEIASAFFPTVRSMEVALISKQFRITGIYGGGKTGPLEEEDKKGWSAERKHLYTESTQITAENLKKQNFPSEIVGIIVDQTDVKPVVISKENSVFPSPTPERPGYQEGGWIVVGLEPEPTKGDARGFLRFETRYTDYAGKQHTITKDVDLGEAEKAIAEGKKEWSSSEGVEKVLVLKQYVDVLRQVLGDKSCFAFPDEFLDWFSVQVPKFGLTKELEKLNQLKTTLAKEAEKTTKPNK